MEGLVKEAEGAIEDTRADTLSAWRLFRMCHLFRGTWPHITAQNDQSISLKNGHSAYFKRFLASRKPTWTEYSF